MYGLLERRNEVIELGNSHVVPHQLLSPFTFGNDDFDY